MQILVVLIDERNSKYYNSFQRLVFSIIETIAEQNSSLRFTVLHYKALPVPSSNIKFIEIDESCTKSIGKLKKHIQKILPNLHGNKLIQITEYFYLKVKIEKYLWLPHSLLHQHPSSLIANYFLKLIKTKNQKKATGINYLSLAKNLPLSPYFSTEIEVDVQYIKDVYADGRNFFLMMHSQQTADSWKPVFKAFSIFKKWLTSNFKLIIVLSENADEMLKQLPHYTYKDDVVLLEAVGENQLSKLIKAATLKVYLPMQPGLNLECYQAIKCGLPMLTNKKVFDSIEMENAFFVAENMLPNTIASQMIFCYKDENHRKNVAYQAKRLLPQNEWDALLQQLIVPLVPKKQDYV